MQGALVQYLVRKLRSQKLYSQEKLKKNNISQEPHTNIKKKKKGPKLREFCIAKVMRMVILEQRVTQSNTEILTGCSRCASEEQRLSHLNVGHEGVRGLSLAGKLQLDLVSLDSRSNKEPSSFSLCALDPRAFHQS